jgi:hypothetical protein
VPLAVCLIVFALLCLACVRNLFSIEVLLVATALTVVVSGLVAGRVMAVRGEAESAGAGLDQPEISPSDVETVVVPRPWRDAALTYLGVGLVLFLLIGIGWVQFNVLGFGLR